MDCPLVFSLLCDYVHIWPNHKYVHEVVVTIQTTCLSFRSSILGLFSFNTFDKIDTYEFVIHFSYVLLSTAITFRIINKHNKQAAPFEMQTRYFSSSENMSISRMNCIHKLFFDYRKSINFGHLYIMRKSNHNHRDKIKQMHLFCLHKTSICWINVENWQAFRANCTNKITFRVTILHSFPAWTSIEKH